MAAVKRGKALVAQLRAQAGVRDPEALAAYLGRYKKARKSGLKPEQAKKVAKGTDNAKSAGVDGMTEPQRRKVVEIQDKIRNRPIEYGYVVGTDGKVLATASGSESQVISYDTAKAARENPDAVSLHNHPTNRTGPSSFSTEDFGHFQQWKPGEFRVATEGRNFVLRPPASGWPDVKATEVESFHRQAFREAHEKWSGKDLPFKEQDTKVTDEAARKTAEKFGYRYKAEKA